MSTPNISHTPNVAAIDYTHLVRFEAGEQPPTVRAILAGMYVLDYGTRLDGLVKEIYPAQLHCSMCNGRGRLITPSSTVPEQCAQCVAAFYTATGEPFYSGYNWAQLQSQESITLRTPILRRGSALIRSWSAGEWRAFDYDPTTGGESIVLNSYRSAALAVAAVRSAYGTVDVYIEKRGKLVLDKAVQDTVPVAFTWNFRYAGNADVPTKWSDRGLHIHKEIKNIRTDLSTGEPEILYTNDGYTVATNAGTTVVVTSTLAEAKRAIALLHSVCPLFAQITPNSNPIDMGKYERAIKQVRNAY